MVQLNFTHLRSFWMTAKAGSLRAASERWHVSQPALSEQIKLLEEALGIPVFRKQSGRLVLTEAGRRAYDYADQIFTLGEELTSSLHSTPAERMLTVSIGVADSLPKLLAWSLVRPALHIDQPVRLNLREGKTTSLLEELVAYRIDAVLCDEPAPSHLPVPVFSQPLASSGITFLALPTLARRWRKNFPASLAGAPLVMPGLGTAMRSSIEKWLHENHWQPRIVVECDDSSMLKAAAHDGVGIVPVPTLEVEEVRARYGFEIVGRVTEEECRLTFYAVTAMRKSRHPAVAAMVKQPQPRVS